jgi:hypothetical protein
MGGVPRMVIPLGQGSETLRMFRRSGCRFADKNMRQRKNYSHLAVVPFAIQN